MSRIGPTVKIPDGWVQANQEHDYIRPSIPQSSNPAKADEIGQIALRTAINMISNAAEGEKFYKLREASYLIGGYVEGGLIDEDEGLIALYNTIQNRTTVQSLRDAFKTIEKCFEAGRQKPITKEMKEAEKKAYINLISQSQQSSSAQTSQETPSTQTPSSYLDALLQTQKKLIEAKVKKVIFPAPIISREGTGIIYPNTINVIQAKDGMHKSRLAGIIGSCILKRPNCSFTHLNLQADASKSYTLLYVDTERNLKDQFPFALQQIQLQAGYHIEDRPSNFDFVSLLEFEREARLTTLEVYLNHARVKYTNHTFVVLDVITDCIGDFNSVRESLKLIDLMNKLINTYNVTFLCVIHENPGSEKARGNIGTEIINKATTVLQIESVKNSQEEFTDVTKVKYRKNRMSIKPMPFFIKYDTDEGLILTDPDFDEPSKQLCAIDDLVDFLESELIGPMTKNKLYKKIETHFNCKSRTVDDRIKKIVEQKIKFFDNEGNLSCLQRKQKGKEAIFELIQIDEENE